MQTDDPLSRKEIDAEPVSQAGEPRPKSGDDVDRLLNPLWLLLVSIVAGLAASGPLAGAIAVRCGYRKLGWAGGGILTVLGTLALVTAVFWGTEWYWTTLSLVAFHTVCGAALFLLLRKPYRVFKENNPRPAGKRGGYRQIISGIVGGAMAALLIGMVGMILYVLLLDRIFSTLMPVTFEDGFAAYKVFMSVLFLILSGAIAGGFIGRAKPEIAPGQIVIYGLGLLWAYLTWSFALEIFIAVPGFQAGAATGFGWRTLISPTLFGHLLVGFWWPVFLLFYIFTPQAGLKKFGRAAQLLGINLAAGLTSKDTPTDNPGGSPTE